MKKVIISLVAFASLGFGDTDNHWLKAVEEICEKSGNAFACHESGMMYLDGLHGVKPNYVKALKFLTKACEAKEDNERKFQACFQL